MSQSTPPAGARYFGTDDDVETEVAAAGCIAMERGCGFKSKSGCGPFGRGGLGSRL